MRDNLDSLIPQEILDLIAVVNSEFDMVLGLTPFAVRGKYPKVKVSINDNIIFDNIVNQTEQIINYKSSADSDIKIRIEFYDKPEDGGTLITPTGEILENQGIDITKFIINGADLIKNNVIYKLGYYYMLLSPRQFKYFQDNGIGTAPSDSLVVRENGYWELNFKTPIMQYLSKIKFKHENIVTEKNLITRAKLSDMYDTVLRIREIEKKLKSK
jgi:hypothetical protein